MPLKIVFLVINKNKTEKLFRKKFSVYFIDNHRFV